MMNVESQGLATNKDEPTALRMIGPQGTPLVTGVITRHADVPST